MYFLLPLPVIFVAAIVFKVSDFFKLKVFKKISKFVIIVCVIYFIYAYLAYKGFNILVYIIDFVKMIIGFFKK